MNKKGNKGKINETKVYVAVLVLIFLTAIIISVVRMGDGGKEPVPTPTVPAATEPGTSVPDDANNTDEPEDSPEPTPSAAPQNTPRLPRRRRPPRQRARLRQLLVEYKRWPGPCG